MTFGTVGGIISLASLFDNVIAWGEFIVQIIQAYRAVVDSFWGPIFDLLPFHSPRWLNDYFTLSGLSAMAVLWSLHQTSIELGFEKLGSTFSAIRRVFFDFSTARSALDSFASKATDQDTFGRPVTDELSSLVWNLARPEYPALWNIQNWIWIAVLFALIPLAPFLIPFLMRMRDRADIRRALVLFGMRRTELVEAAVDDSVREAISRVFERQIVNFMNFEDINDLYYRKVTKHQAWYYGAVFALFGLLVLANYTWSRIQMMVS